MNRTSVTVLLFLQLVSPALAAASHQEQLTIWKDFIANYNKTYRNFEEEFQRFKIWTENFRVIQRHNEAADRGDYSFWLKLNHLADMTPAEIDDTMKGLDVDVDTGALYMYTEDDLTPDLPASVDWRNKGYVTPVKYQGHCGGCYAFSATGALEGQHFRKTGQLVSLSEQNILDCTYRNQYNNHGCHGGLMDHAFNYVIQNGGVDTEESYPYEGIVGQCRFNKSNVGSKAHSYMDILPRGDETRLQAVVAERGPVSVGIDAHGYLFHFYSHGVYDNLGCSSRKLDHAVLIVGYGQDNGGQDYWIVKNSWSRAWGDDGYIKMARNKDNQCGIASLASIPEV